MQFGQRVGLAMLLYVIALAGVMQFDDLSTGYKAFIAIGLFIAVIFLVDPTKE